jgi:uncharacterized protein YoxC
MLIALGVLTILIALHFMLRSLGEAIERVESRLDSIERKLPQAEGQHNRQEPRS